MLGCQPDKHGLDFADATDSYTGTWDMRPDFPAHFWARIAFFTGLSKEYSFVASKTRWMSLVKVPKSIDLWTFIRGRWRRKRAG